MKINFTKKEYVALIDLLEMADWVLNAHKTETPGADNVYQGLIQKIYSFSKEMGCEDLIEYDEKLHEYFPTGEFDETSETMQFIEDYNNDTFWDELISRLVNRDLLNEMGQKKLHEMSLDLFFAKQTPLEEKYSIEFETNGLKNLYLKDANPKGVTVYRIN
ncbi:MAG: hypothetical protein Q8N83_09325 [Ignavibacteria bacterium]|nr:hypothetical protein [Ignavibacteria bacterium]